MSLLVFSSSNKVAQGVIRRLYGNNTFERIICADLYPNYWPVKRFLKFREELEGINSKTELTDIKISEKSDLVRALNKSSHALYITHDYYSLAPSKLNLIKTFAELSKNKVQKLVCLTPVEYDHYGERDPIIDATKSEKQAREANPDLVHLKCDLTFGDKSGAVKTIIRRIVNGESISYNPTSGNQQAAPIHINDVAQIVEASLTDGANKGSSILLQGGSTISIGDLISLLQRHVGKSLTLNGSLERVLPPYSRNLISERLYTPEYSNLAGLLRHYRALDRQGFADLSKFNLKLATLEETYKERAVDESQYKSHDESSLETFIKRQVY